VREIPRLLFSSLLLFALIIPSYSQDSIGDLFTDPDQGIIEEGENLESDDSSQSDTIVEQEEPEEPSIFTGSANIKGGMLIGISEWGNPFEDLGLWDIAPFGDYGVSLKLDIRPEDYLRFYSSFTTDFPNQTVKVDELFFDYTLADSVFIRAGKFSMTWGQGQIINPGDFVSNAINSFALKTFFPLATNGFTAVVMADLEKLESGFDSASYSGLFDFSLGPVVIGLSSYFDTSVGLQSSTYIKTPILGIDSAIEGVITWGDLTANEVIPQAEILAAFFSEFADGKGQIIAEYLFDTSIANYLGHTLALGIRAKSVLAPKWDLGIFWQHEFAFSAGQVIIGMDGPIAPSVNLALGVPLRYGTGGSGYISVLGAQIPGDPAIAFIAQLSIGIDF
jgi:hypothetical protein